MNRRAWIALGILLAALAWIGLALAADVWGGRLAAIAVLGLPLIVAFAHQYRRWRRFRPAVNLVLLFVAFVAGISWYLGPAGVTPEPLGASERTTIRLAAAGVLFLVLTGLASIARN